MRRWVCIVALLAGFSRDGYAWSVRPRIPVGIERPFRPPAVVPAAGGAPRRPVPTSDWWLRA